MRLAVIMEAQKKTQNRLRIFSMYHMKPSGNESFNGPDHKMVCDTSFFGFFIPDRSLQSSTDEVTI